MLHNLSRKAPTILVSKAMSNRLAMAVTTLIRMAVSLGVFVLLARSLGPADYGFITTVLAYAALVGLITDFGFNQKTLRDIAATPAQGGSILAASLSVKGLLVTSVCVIGGLVIYVSPLEPATKMAAAMLAAGLLIASVGDLALVSFRSLGRFSSETWLVTWTSAAHAGIMCAILLLHLKLVAVSAGFLTSRLFYMSVALMNVQRLFPHQRLRVDNFRDILGSMRRSRSWAVDNGLGFLNGQLDSLFVAHIMGLSSAGEYQSGARFAQGALNGVAVLTNIHITALAAGPKTKELSRRELRMIAEFATAGAFFASILLFGGHFISTYLLGDKYKSVDALWPGLAAFVQIRFISSAFASALAARAQPVFRIFGQVAGLATLIIGFTVVVPKLGLPAAAWTMAAGSLMQALIFAFARLGGLEAALGSFGARFAAPPRVAVVTPIEAASASPDQAKASKASGALSPGEGERRASCGGSAT